MTVVTDVSYDAVLMRREPDLVREREMKHTAMYMLGRIFGWWWRQHRTTDGWIILIGGTIWYVSSVGLGL